MNIANYSAQREIAELRRKLAETEAERDRDMAGWNECVADLQATVVERDRLRDGLQELAAIAAKAIGSSR